MKFFTASRFRGHFKDAAWVKSPFTPTSIELRFMWMSVCLDFKVTFRIPLELEIIQR